MKTFKQLRQELNELDLSSGRLSSNIQDRRNTNVIHYTPKPSGTINKAVSNLKNFGRDITSKISSPENEVKQHSANILNRFKPPEQKTPITPKFNTSTIDKQTIRSQNIGRINQLKSKSLDKRLDAVHKQVEKNFPSK